MDFIAYAKANAQPMLTDSVSQCLNSAYVDLRKVGSGRGQITDSPDSWRALFGWRRLRLRCGSQLLWSSLMWRRRDVYTTGP